MGPEWMYIWTRLHGRSAAKGLADPLERQEWRGLDGVVKLLVWLTAAGEPDIPSQEREKARGRVGERRPGSYLTREAKAARAGCSPSPSQGGGKGL